MASTKEILDHHLKCFVGVDLDGIAEFAKPGFSATVEKQSVEGD
jgi:hypothetical protein